MSSQTETFLKTSAAKAAAPLPGSDPVFHAERETRRD